MLKNIPISRAILYLLLIGSLPLFFVFFLFIAQKNELRDVENTIENIQYQALSKERKQALNAIVCQHFRDSDHFYIDKHLETIVLLEPEIEQLQKIQEDKNFTDDERIKKRADFLTGEGNALVFSEGVVQSFPLFNETIETLVHSVEVNENDIKKILSRIEGIQIGEHAPTPNSPQLLVTEFKLDKKKINDKNEVYLLNLKLIKREFL